MLTKFTSRFLSLPALVEIQATTLRHTAAKHCTQIGSQDAGHWWCRRQSLRHTHSVVIRQNRRVSWLWAALIQHFQELLVSPPTPFSVLPFCYEKGLYLCIWQKFACCHSIQNHVCSNPIVPLSQIQFYWHTVVMYLQVIKVHLLPVRQDITVHSCSINGGVPQ